ncbi:MAG TPA: DUF488 domain-containing protein [Spongiibacteraceae bacterium]|jgi:uncharacterized protein (DUF488 family)|nr:DUF488 domain-containing protein [Spongiibacteraceae bacterium]
MLLPFYTIGHSTRTIGEFVALLQSAEVTQVIDIRAIPKSRTNPQYNLETLPGHLAPFQINYRQIPELGGLRSKRSAVPQALNGFWENRSFHNYADYALSEPFRAGLEQLIALGRRGRCAMMCSEAVWWRCHRRIVADHLLARGETVFHLMGRDRITPAKLTDGARVSGDGTVSYPPQDAPGNSQPPGQ